MPFRRPAVWLVFALALLFLALHLPYLPRSLEDLDSINFALGVRQFDVAHHQPHPPGYPVFIVLAKGARLLAGNEARALAAVGVVAGALGVIAIAAVYPRIAGGVWSSGWSIAATGVAITSPLYWFTAARPLSDMAGLAAALGVQALTLGATSTRALALAGLAAGVATGIRSQVAWLTVPLLIARGLGPGSWGLGPGSWPLGAGGWGLAKQPGPSARFLAPAIGFALGALLWLAPLVAISGGPQAYFRALSNQGAEDFGNISMLWTTHTLRAAEDALYFAFVAPWAAWTTAAAVLTFAVIGCVWLARRDRTALALLAAAFGPYLVFDLLFQETFTGRYALPLVVPIAFLAAAGLRLLPARMGLVAAVLVAMFDAHVGGTSIAAFSREKAPAFRLLDDMAAPRGSTAAPPVLAFDRRNMFDFRRSVVWTGAAMPRIDRQLPSPPQHEWLEAVKYWNSDGRAPVWFVVDPARAAIDLVQHGAPTRYRWGLPYPDLVSGARPNEMDWYQVDRPEWYVGEGWSLTPEAAGVADADRRGLAFGAINAWVAASANGGGTVMIGGRSFETSGRARLSVTVDGRVIADRVVAPGPFLFFAPLPTDADARRYASLSLSTQPRARIGVEQFDASAVRPLAGFGPGWQEPELNPRTGARWRWLSERGELEVRPSGGRASLHVEGESPRRYFSRGSRLRITSGGVAAFDRVLTDDFAIDVPIASGDSTIVLETDQVYVPAERSRRTQDRRHLGLRIFTCELRPVP